MLRWISIFGGLLIMMGQHARSEALFYYFRLEDQVPENHLLRLIDQHISFEFVRERLRDSYSETGRPSIDPELLLRILLIGYLYGISGCAELEATGAVSSAGRQHRWHLRFKKTRRTRRTRIRSITSGNTIGYGSFSSRTTGIPRNRYPISAASGAIEGSGRLFPEAAAMGFELRVSLTDLKSACRRLLARLPDEMEAACDFILFKAGGSSLEIVSGGTSEVLKAVILHPGEASVPEPVFRGIARALRFYRGRTATVAASRGLLRIDRTEFRHPNISVLASGTGQDIAGTKPAKLQNL